MSNYQSARQQYSFEDIYQQYTPLVYGMLKRLHIHSNHEDFVQAGYVGLWLAYQHHDGEKGPFPPYAFVRVSGEMLTMLKKDANYYDRHSFSPNDQEPAQVRIETESWMPDLDTLAPYLNMLSDREQRWVIEHAVHDLPPRMIAAKYNVSVETVKGWRKGALAKLKKYVK
ncbi:sigma-70 family RNA polymerase sigma factor [Salicibibacter kimchii]|uniref:sigma-70 family RNA polymerase sigma factor n=1 Tax=Salicibibacter kimchii TaxID=2099786 RepID=UPI001358B08D|nr:sigma-70 family RNA polymerase sigma factor [Salicibibacter kimchii]